MPEYARPPGRPWVPRIKLACAGCGELNIEKTAKEAARTNRSFCAACRDKRRNVEWQCRTCGKRKTVMRSYAEHYTRCERCRPTTLRPMEYVTATCGNCGNEFGRRVPQGMPPRFCADRCRLAWFSTAFRGAESPQWLDGQTLKYGVHWKQVRRVVYARDGHRCRACGRGRGEAGRLSAAHLIPRREFDEPPLQGPLYSDAPSNLVTLCTSCHISFDRAVETRWDYDLHDRQTWPAWAPTPAWPVGDLVKVSIELLRLYRPDLLAT